MEGITIALYKGDDHLSWQTTRMRAKQSVDAMESAKTILVGAHPEIELKWPIMTLLNHEHMTVQE